MRALVVAAILLSASCTRTDPLFCDDDTPCTDPARPFCDVSGQFPASDGVGKTCIADPNAADSDGGVGEIDAAQLGCTDSDDCAGTVPICDALLCRGCAVDDECAAKDPGAPRCLSDGACGECGDDADCADPEPICDSGSRRCRGCAAHTECDAGVCDLNTGSCAAAADLVFVDSVDGTDGINCGDGPDQAACATIGGVLGGLAKVTATRKYVVVSADAYTESILIDGLEVFLVATGAVNDPFFLVNQPALAVSGAAEVTVDGLTLQRASGVIGGVGLNCVGESTVRLHNAVVSENELGGLRANDCTIEIRASSIRGNEGFGVSINSGSATLLGSTIEQNERAGLVIEESPFAIENCFVVRNGSTFFAGSGGVQVKNSAAISSVAQVFTHNTVTQNESGVGVAGLQCNTVNAVAATSNLIHGNNPSSAPADADTSGNCAQSHSNVEGLTGGTGNLDMPPIFVAPQATVGNFHLAPGSPGIDVADPASTTSIDFDGDPRPVGAGFDMGADEVN